MSTSCRVSSAAGAVRSRAGTDASLPSRYPGTMTTAWGHGLATIAADGTVLDTWFPAPALGARPASAEPHRCRSRSSSTGVGTDARARRAHRAVLVEIDPDAAPASTPDAYLRLHLLSHLLVLPNRAQPRRHLRPPADRGLDHRRPDASGHTCVAARARCSARASRCSASTSSRGSSTTSCPTRVRIADASRVRLGAHLSPGTTVMHEGFVNFNAGTLGTSMVEGRISQGVVVGDGSDIGGGASIMGTLSGGGTERVVIGERSLLGANSGIGISIGDDSRRRGRPLRDRRHQGDPAAAGEPAYVKAVELSAAPRHPVPPQLAHRCRRGPPRTGHGIPERRCTPEAPTAFRDARCGVRTGVRTQRSVGQGRADGPT